MNGKTELVSFVSEVADLASTKSILNHDDLSKALERNQTIFYQKRDFVFRSGYWRGNPIKSVFSSLNQEKLVLGHSDYSTNQLHGLLLKVRHKNLRIIWSSNVETSSFFLREIPLGLTNYCNDSDFHPIFGNQMHIAQALNFQDQREPRLYANFNVNTYPKYRKRLLKYLGGLGLDIQFGDATPTNGGRIKYLREIRRYGFVICPRGNGKDTHRLFETLAMGSVPVLLEEDVPSWLARSGDLPFISLKNWNELNQLKLANHFDSLDKVNIEKLKTDYWASLIRDS
jgi:hypothetical protein